MSQYNQKDDYNRHIVEIGKEALNLNNESYPSEDKKQRLEKQLGEMMTSVGRLLQHPKHLEVSWMEQQARMRDRGNGGGSRNRSSSPWNVYSPTSGEWSEYHNNGSSNGSVVSR